MIEAKELNLFLKKNVKKCMRLNLSLFKGNQDKKNSLLSIQYQDKQGILIFYVLLTNLILKQIIKSMI
jgi:hypothetical protein